VTPADYEFLRLSLKARSGVVLAADKQYLVESRLLPVARRNGFNGLVELVAALRAATDETLMTAAVEAMTTHESFFFRDKTPFDQFRAVILPGLLEARRASRRLRIWCAAASTGQEPYSLAMCLKERERDLVGWHVELLATDLSTEVLQRARQGVYTHFEVQRGLPIQYLVRHFTQIGTEWKIADQLRAMVGFRQFNLLSDFASLGTFDLILCRNVLIYFDQATKTDVLNRLWRNLAPDGHLVLGAAETAIGFSDRYKMASTMRGVYVPNPAIGRNSAPFRPRLVAVGGS
jgi:chemotaxis protein methyltransferase CheR